MLRSSRIYRHNCNGNITSGFRDVKIFRKDVNRIVNKNEPDAGKIPKINPNDMHFGILSTDDETERAFDEYESYAKLCSGEVVEINIDGEIHYGVLTIDRWKNVPDSVRSCENFHHYDIRHDDEGEPVSIKSHILVNHFGTFITYDKIHISDEEKEIELGYIN